MCLESGTPTKTQEASLDTSCCFAGRVSVFVFKKMPQLNNNRIALAGEFAVLAELYKRNFDASLTLGNTKSVDILVSSESGSMIKLEVKTSIDNKRPKLNRLFGLDSRNYCKYLVLG